MVIRILFRLIFQVSGGKITTYFSTLKTQLQDVWKKYNVEAEKAGSLTESLQGKISGLAGDSASLRGYLTSLGGSATASLDGYIDYLSKAEIKTVALNAATAALNVALNLGVSLLAGFAINKITEAVHAAQKAREEAAETAKEMQDLRNSLTDLTEQYRALYAETGGTWDTTSLASVKSIQQQIVDLVGDQADNIDLVNGKLGDQIKLLRGIAVEQSRNWLRDNQQAAQSSREYLEKQRTSVIGAGGLMSSNPGVVWMRDNHEKFGFDVTSTGSYEINGTVDEIIDAYTRMYDELDRYGREHKISDEVEDELVRISDAINAMRTDEYTDAKEAYEGWLQNEAVVSQAEVLKTGFASQDEYNSYILSLGKLAGGNRDLQDAMLEVVQTAFPEFDAASKAATEAANAQATGLDYLAKKYSDLNDVSRKQNSDLSKFGNVDLLNRPQVHMDDGSIATVLTSNQEFTLGPIDAAQDVIIHYTPILPDGTVLSDEAIDDYLYSLVEQSSNAAELLSNDAKANGIILKIDTQLDYNLSDQQKDVLWNAIGDQYETLADAYATNGVDALKNKLMEMIGKAKIPIQDALKYLTSLFNADQWDNSLHLAQAAFYETGESATSFGAELQDVIDKSDTLTHIMRDMSASGTIEYLSGQTPGSANNLTDYLNVFESISQMQKQLTDAQNQMVGNQSLSADTANDIYATLTSAGENYLDYLVVEGDQIKLNTEAYREFIKTQAYERSGIPELTRALADQLGLRQQIQEAERNISNGADVAHVAELKQQLVDLEAQYGNIEQLKEAIQFLDKYFNLGWDESNLVTGLEGLDAALKDTATDTGTLELAIQSLQQNGNLDNLTQADFSTLLSQFPKLKRALNDYSKGLISSTKLMEIFQQTLDGISVSNTFSDLGNAKDSISALASVVKELNEGDGVSFSSLEKIQSTFSNVSGIDDYIAKLKDAKTYSADVADVVGTLLYQSLIDAMGSTQALAEADEGLVAMMLKEAGVANSAVAAHQAVEQAKKDNATASKALSVSSADDINALVAEGLQCGYTKQQLYELYATQIIFNNTNMDVSQKIAALNQLAQACGITVGYINGVANSIAGMTGWSSRDINRTIDGLVKTGQAANKEAAAQMLLSRAYQSQIKSTNPFSGIDFSGLGSGGGGSSATKAEQIKSAFDDLNSSLEHAIYLEQQYYTVADSEYDYDGMKQALQNQVGYYKQIQAAAESAMEQVRAYYRSKGMSDAVIEQQSEIQALQKAWWEAANSIDESLDKIATAIRDKLSKEVDDIQNAWSSLQKAAEEYSSTGVISIDSLQAIISAGVEYVSLLKDENGQLVLNEDAVSAVLEAKTQQLAVESALSYVEQVRNALMQNNVTELNRLLDVTSVTASSTWDLVYAQAALLNLNGNQYNQLINNINKFRSIATTTVKTIRKQVRNSVQNETKDYKSALDDVLKLVEDLIKYEHEQMVDALEDQRDLYTELIQKKKDLLQQTKDEEDYESNVSKKLKEISHIQDQINRLSLDDSREAAAKRASLEEELADLQESLADYIGDYTSGKNEETLDKAAEDYSQYIGERIKKVEDEISSEEKLYRAAIERINSDWGGLYQDILDWNYKAGSSIESEIIEKWALASEAVQRYGSFVAAAQATAAGNSLGDSFSYDYDQSAGDPAATAAANTIVERMKANAAAWHGASKSEQARLSAENEQLAQQLAQYVGAMPTKDHSGVWWLNGQKLFDIYPKYHQGGVVGGLQNEKQKELLTVLKDGELVSTAQMQDRTIELIDFADNIAKRLKALPYMNGFGSLLKNDVMTALPKLTPAQGGSQSMVFSPSIQVTIQHNGSVSDSDAELYGNKIADITLGKLSEAFGKKGIRNFSGTLLKA